MHDQALKRSAIARDDSIYKPRRRGQLGEPFLEHTIQLKAKKNLRPQEEQACLVQPCLYLLFEAHGPAACSNGIEVHAGADVALKKLTSFFARDSGSEPRCVRSARDANFTTSRQYGDRKLGL